MKELSNYLEHVSSIKPNQDFGLREGFLFTETKLNNFDNCQIALIGITETRNAYQKIEDVDLSKVRSFLYSLTSFQRINVCDLGNLKNGTTVKDTYASINFVSNYLMQKGITPVFFGGTQDLTVPIFKSFSKKNTECVIIDSRFDIGNDELHSKNYIQDLITEATSESTITIAGHQSYFVAQEQMDKIEKSDNYHVRLGLIRNNFSFIEPILRDADFVSFDLSAIRQPDCPSSTAPGPNGFYNEEACQLANLAGLSDKLEAAFFTEYLSSSDLTGQSAQLLAQLIWHFIYGVSQRKGDYPLKNINDYKKIFVKVEKPDTELIFYQNPSNNRFWVEIPTSEKDGIKIISCSEKDYRSTCVGEIPDRIWKNMRAYFK